MSKSATIFFCCSLALGASAAPSNVAAPATNATLSAAADSVEQEFQKLLASDDAAKTETVKWIRDNDEFAAKGVGLTNEELNRRIFRRLEPVRAAYRDFLLQHPEHVRARIAYGSLLLDLQEDGGAREQWERALALETNNPAIYDDLATYYAQHGPREKAFEYLEKAVRLDSRQPLYAHNLAEAVYLLPKDAQAYYHLTQEEAVERATQLYSNALRLDPANFPFATDVAMTYYAMRPFEPGAAMQAWTNALKLAKDEVDRQGVFLHFARVNVLAGRFDEARRHLDAVTIQNYVNLKGSMLRQISEQETAAKGTNGAVEVKGAVRNP